MNTAESLTKQAAATSDLDEREALLRLALDQEVSAFLRGKTIQWPRYGDYGASAAERRDDERNGELEAPTEKGLVDVPEPIASLPTENDVQKKGETSHASIQQQQQATTTAQPRPQVTRASRSWMPSASKPTTQLYVDIKATIETPPPARKPSVASSSSVQTSEYTQDTDGRSETLSPTRRKPRKLEVRQKKKKKPRKLEVRSEAGSL